MVSFWFTSISTISARIISISTWWGHSHCTVLALQLHLPFSLWGLLLIHSL